MRRLTIGQSPITSFWFWLVLSLMALIVIILGPGKAIANEFKALVGTGKSVTGNLDEENMYTFIKSQVELKNYDDASGLCSEFATKFPKSLHLDEVNYLAFYSLFKGSKNKDYTKAYDYILSYTSKNKDKVLKMLSLTYALSEGTDMEKEYFSRSVDANKNVYNGLLYVSENKKEEAKKSFENNFKYTDSHELIYLNFPSYDLYTYYIQKKNTYPYLINNLGILQFSRFAYFKIDGCNNLNPYLNTYIAFLTSSDTNIEYHYNEPSVGNPIDKPSEKVQILNPISGSSKQSEYVYLKSVCPDIGAKLCSAYQDQFKSYITYIDPKQRKEQEDKLTKNMLLFDPQMSSCEVTS